MVCNSGLKRIGGPRILSGSGGLQYPSVQRENGYGNGGGRDNAVSILMRYGVISSLSEARLCEHVLQTSTYSVN